MRVARRRVAAPLFGLVLVTILGGCSLLYGFGPYPFPEPSPGKPATYTSGTAKLTLADGTAIQLGDLTEGGTSGMDIGASATFRNADGWYLRIMGATRGSPSYMPSFITIDRIVDKQHWTTYDSTRCSVEIARADETGLSGTASCKDLRWADALATGMSPNYEPPYIKDQPAFDVEITFEAAPSTTQSS